MMEYHLGVDSTDSATLGMCTTYLGARILPELEAAGCILLSPPDLVRLNPNVPWKTRGNGAVAIRFEAEEGRGQELLDLAVRMVDEYAVMEDPQANPGVALQGGPVHPSLEALYHNALHRIVDIDQAIGAGLEAGALMKGYKNSRGLIGALAAIGACSMKPWTWELMAYRDPALKTKERDVDLDSLRRATSIYPKTFFNTDEKGDPACIPHSPCPVLFGIRSLTPEDACGAASEIISGPVERWVLWRTNQHTDAHILGISSLAEAKDYSSISIEVVVSSSPSYRNGGHLRFDISDHLGAMIGCWAYEPTKSFRHDLSHLVPGDRIRIWGSVRPESKDHPVSISLEKVHILDLETVYRSRNPRCPSCGSATGSMGRGQGLRCKSCGNRDGLARMRIEVPRKLRVGPIDTPVTAWRHLFRPSWLEPLADLYKGPGPIHGTERVGC